MVDSLDDAHAPARWTVAPWAEAGLDEAGRTLPLAASATGLAVPLRFAGLGYAQAVVSRAVREDLSDAAALAIDVALPAGAPALGAKIVVTLGEDLAWTEPAAATPLAPGAVTTVRLDLAGALERPLDPARLADVRAIGVKIESAAGARWRGAVALARLRACWLVPAAAEDAALRPVGTFGGFVTKGGAADIPARNGSLTFTAALDGGRVKLLWPALDAKGRDLEIGSARAAPGGVRFRDWSTIEMGGALLSRAFPAGRFRSDARTFAWESNARRAAFVRDGAVVTVDLDSAGAIDLARMSEPWILLSRGLAPVLLTFERRPLRAQAIADGLTFSFSGPVGAVNVLPLLGIVRPSRAERAAWDAALPAAAIARCRAWVPMLAAFPISCEERAAVDEAAGTVAITEEYRYDEIADDWGTAPRRIAPVPPLVARAASCGYPVAFDAPLVECGVATFFGPFVFADGTRARFTLPLPAGVSRLPVAVRTIGSPVAEAAHQKLCRLIAEETPAAPADFYLDNDDRAVAFLAEAWPALGPGERARALAYAPRALEHGFAPGSLQALTEPVSGQGYLNSAKYWASEEAFDKEWYDGRQLAAAALFAENVDARLVRRLWPKVRGLYRYDRIFFDWATGSALSSCYGLTALADGMHFAWEGMLGTARLARLFGDEATRQDACWHAARQQAALYAAWFQADWARRCDYAIGHLAGRRLAAADVEARFAIDGYTEETGCTTLELKSFWQTTNFLFFDCVPQLAFYRDFGLAPRVRALEYEAMPTLHPAWRDGNAKDAVGGRYYGDELAMAHVMARALLFAEPAANLLPIYDGTAGSAAAREWYSGRRYGIAGPTLLAIERADAPAIEAPCGLAAVEGCRYDVAAKRLRMEMRGRASGVGVVRIEARGSPRAVRVNGREEAVVREGPFWLLVVPFAPGEAAVVEADFE